MSLAYAPGVSFGAVMHERFRPARHRFVYRVATLRLPLAQLAQIRVPLLGVDRPNLFVKIPATADGLPAITACLAEGISVNVTLIFSLERYRAVVDAFLTGLERRAEAGGSLEGIASVASFFVSRVDAEVDRRLDARAGDSDGHRLAKRLRGRAAVANARLAYQIHEETLASPRWRALAAAGARPQRPLWASTGVKDPAYEDTRYVVELALPGTVNTMPEATLEAAADHGWLPERVPPRAEIYQEAQAVLEELREAGISLDEVAAKLEAQGVASFEESWDELIATVTGQLEQAGAEVMPAGATRPAGEAGGGPAAAAPRATAR